MTMIRADVDWESYFSKIFHLMCRIFKSGLESLGWQWGYLNLASHLLKNKVIKKTKLRSIKIFKRVSLHSAKLIYGRSWYEIVVIEYLSLTQTLQIYYKVCNSQVSILESLRFHRFLLNRNVDQFIFIIFKECFFTDSVTRTVRCLG